MRPPVVLASLLRSLPILCATILPSRTFAQAVLLPSISFAGAPAYPPATLLAVTGLKPGGTSTPAAIHEGAQHLLDTGLFADVRFASFPKGLLFTLKPMPEEGLATARFANFVWRSPEELNVLVRARQPLFQGSPVLVIPGDQYWLKPIQTSGRSDAQKREFDSTWHMHPGDFYDVTCSNVFLRQNTTVRTLEGYSGKYRAVADPDTHLVDLTVTFVKGGTLLEEPA